VVGHQDGAPREQSAAPSGQPTASNLSSLISAASDVAPREERRRPAPARILEAPESRSSIAIPMTSSALASSAILAMRYSLATFPPEYSPSVERFLQVTYVSLNAAPIGGGALYPERASALTGGPQLRQEPPDGPRNITLAGDP